MNRRLTQRQQMKLKKSVTKKAEKGKRLMEDKIGIFSYVLLYKTVKWV